MRLVKGSGSLLLVVGYVLGPRLGGGEVLSDLECGRGGNCSCLNVKTINKSYKKAVFIKNNVEFGYIYSRTATQLYS